MHTCRMCRPYSCQAGMELRTIHKTFMALLLLTVVLLLVGNWLTQPYEDSISAFPSATPFYKDYVWYLDDIVAPAGFVAGGLTLLAATLCAGLSKRWPLVLLALTFLVLGVGDTFDVHWVLTEGSHATDEVKSFGSFGSKIMSVIVLGYSLIYAWPFLSARAGRALLFTFLLVMIDQIHIAVSLEFAGFSFHVFEECIEVVASVFLAVAVWGGPLKT